MEKKLLYINKNEAEKEKLRKVRMCAMLHRAKLVAADAEEVASLPENAELMKMIGFGRDMENFLRDLRKQGVSVKLKCIETDGNKDWSLRQLYEELQRERASMAAQQE